jgi:hypothetical protein
VRRQGNPRDTLASDGITPELFRTQPGAREKVTDETQQAARVLARRSARSGRLSPLGYNLTISHQHRFMWFRVAKVGTRTILGYFTEHNIPIDVGHAMKLRYPTVLFDDYFKFAFVRHPLGRFISAWHNKVVDQNYFGFDDAQLASMQVIENFAHWTARRDLANADHHLAPQTRLIDLTQIDHLGRLETFDDDFAAICSLIGLPASRPTALNRSSHHVTPDTASDELKSIVGDLYRLDFQVFGY